MNVSPKISVLMSVLNCERTLQESLDCLCAQTETDWTLILCDDGSTDGTVAIAEQFAKIHSDKCLLLKNQRNLGLSASLNRCLAAATGEFIARMDGDDRCSSERFREELRTLRENPTLSIVSCDMQCFDEEGIWGLKQYPEVPVNKDYVKGTPFCHAGCMVRRADILAVGGYSEQPDCARVEDYDLWVRMAAAGHYGRNLRLPLYQMRDDRNAAARRKMTGRLNEARVRLKAVRLLHLPLWMSVYALRPLILGLIPLKLYNRLHRGKLSR